MPRRRSSKSKSRCRHGSKVGGGCKRKPGPKRHSRRSPAHKSRSRRSHCRYRRIVVKRMSNSTSISNRSISTISCCCYSYW